MAPITGRVSRHLVTPGNLVQGSDGGSTLLTSIVSLDPIYIYFDVDEATYQRNSRLWFEGKRPSSRDTPNPVQVTLTGETKPSHDGKMDFLDNRLDASTGTLRSRAVIPNKDLSILPGQFGRVRIIGSAPYEALLLPDTAIATDQSRKIVFVVKDDNTVEAKPVMLGSARRRPARDPRGAEARGPRDRRRPAARPRRRESDAAYRRQPSRPVARHESRPAFHQPAHPGDGAVDRAADRRRDRLHHAAGLGISASGAADGGGHHAISGRLRANRLRHRRRADRAGDQRRRGHAVSLQPGDLERAVDDHGHVQARHRSRQGPGAGAEPRRDRAAAAAGRGAAQRRRHPQEQPRHPDGRVHAVAGRHVRPALHQQLRAAAGPRPVAPARRHRRHPDVRRARLFDAAVARSRQDRHAGPDRGRGGGGDPRAKRADRRRPDRGAADHRPRVFAEPHLHRPPEGPEAVRGHRRQGRRRRAHGQAARCRADRTRRAGLLHQQLPAAEIRRRHAGDAAARLERARDRQEHLQHHGKAEERAFRRGSTTTSATTRPNSSRSPSAS